MSTIANRLAFLNNRIAWYENKYFRNNIISPTPSRHTEMMYNNWRRERTAMNRAARRIQRAVRTRRARKTAQLMSYAPNFRRLNEKDQRAILSLVFRR